MASCAMARISSSLNADLWLDGLIGNGVSVEPCALDFDDRHAGLERVRILLKEDFSAEESRLVEGIGGVNRDADRFP